MPVLVDKIFRVGEGKTQRRLERIAKAVNSIEEDYLAMSDEELREQTADFKKRYENGESLDDLMYEAFATVREAAKRTLGQRHFDVQLMGGAALHEGNVAEMRTGEGKTLVSTLPAYLNAISGKGVHIVTTNDYLARRDAEWMGRVHQFLGLEVGVIEADMSQTQRHQAYNADITYGTNSEFGFDYLRDNMSWTLEDCVQRSHNFAIVDEVDSILIDEARTPLIISGAAEVATRRYTDCARLAPRLRRDVDYEVDEKKQTVAVLESGVDKVEDHFGIDNMYGEKNSELVSFVNNAIRAKELYKRDKDYVVQNDEVLIVDEFTGRILYGRRYNEGLHQAIEAKEGVEVQQENQTLATITLQNFFRLYDKLAGMTGTAMTEANEFQKTYKLGVIPIRTNKPPRRDDRADVVFKSEEAKYDAVAEDIAERNENGQPVLVGTTSVERSEYLSRLLKHLGIKHEVLNAKYHEKEAAIIAKAGRKGAVTVATNMAGRGTDIVLGGNPEFEADLELHRKGLTPLETPDEYEDAYPGLLEEWKERTATEHEEVVEAGGLYVVGTERHESRRIDNQLRGRSGRQGDPGESRFYLSLEDELMRRFNASMVERVMTTLNIPEDVPIESKMVTRSIRSAQTQVEQQNFETRKNVLKYDEVMNRQREVVYAERRRVLEGDDMSDALSTMVDDVVDAYVSGATGDGFAEEWDLDELWKALGGLYPIDVDLDELDEESGGRSGLAAELIAEKVKENAHAAYARREEEIGVENMRELERQVLLEVLDRKWREHLYEMDYLKEGIGLRAMAQRDPVIEYQREGFELFATMMDGIKEEAVRLAFVAEIEPADAGPELSPAALRPVGGAGTGDEDEVRDTPPAADGNGSARKGAGKRSGRKGAARTAVADESAGEPADAEPAGSGRPAVRGPGMRGERKPAGGLTYSAPSLDGDTEGEAVATAAGDDEFAGVSRNAPCPCGSGRKYKRCHGSPDAG